MRHLVTYKLFENTDSNWECMNTIQDILLDFDDDYKGYAPYYGVDPGNQNVGANGLVYDNIYIKIGYNDPTGELIGYHSTPKVHDCFVNDAVYKLVSRIISYMKSNGYDYEFIVGIEEGQNIKFGFDYPHSCVEIVFSKEATFKFEK